MNGSISRCTATTDSHLFLVIGTSAVVHPAAGLIYEARSAGAFVIEVNPAETEATSLTHAVLRGSAAVMLPSLVEMIS